MIKCIKSLTLLELIISIVLFSAMMLGIFTTDLFVRNQVSSANQAIAAQNDVTLVQEHISLRLRQAIGDINNPPVNNAAAGGFEMLRFFSDTNADGIRTALDTWRAYRFDATNHRISYCAACTTATCVTCAPAWPAEILSSRITAFTTAYDFTTNFIEITNITACWNPAGAAPNACGSLTNPQVTMINRVKMPSVSTN